jgi:cytochrome P450 family 6
VVRKDFLQLMTDLLNKGYVADVDKNKQTNTEGESATEPLQLFFKLTPRLVVLFPDSQRFTITEAAAQAFVFFIGGFETSSTTMQFALYELALNQEIQDRLREDVNNVLEKHDGIISYESLHEMEYLDRVVAGVKRECS